MDVKAISRQLRFGGQAVKLAEKMLAAAAKAGIEAPARKRRKSTAKVPGRKPGRPRKVAAGVGAAKEESGE